MKAEEYLKVKGKPIVFIGYSKEIKNSLDKLGLIQYKPDDIEKVYTRIGVDPDRKSYTLLTNWEWSMFPIPEGKFYECTDSEQFLEIIAFELYKSSSCLDEAIDRCNDYNELISKKQYD
jgi:hypothetical protein